MIEIPLSQGLFAIVEDVDNDLSKETWHAVLSSKTHYAMQNARLDGEWATTSRMHRVIMERSLGRAMLEEEIVDHKDGNGLNNRRSNLRLATKAQNSANQPVRKNNTSGMKGVSFSKRDGKWTAYITVNRKLMHLGTFKSKTEAAKSYNAAALQYFGEFAFLNIIPESEA
jgi:hypothetical protein